MYANLCRMLTFVSLIIRQGRCEKGWGISKAGAVCKDPMGLEGMWLALNRWILKIYTRSQKRFK